MTSELLQGFYLGDALVEPLKGQVTGRDSSTHLPPKAVEVLLCLAETPGEVVSRDTLLDRVWGVGHGSQEALSHAVSEIRHAFNDSHHDPHVVQTLPKRGYRLLLTPQLVSEATSSVVIGAKDGARPSDIGFIENLKRRGVLETLVAYLIVGWLLIQVADIVFERLGLPDKAATFVTWLVVAGLPIALIVSWYLEFRDGRLVVHDLTPADARRRRFSHTYLSVIGALALAGGLVFVYDQNVGLPEKAADFEVTASGSPRLPPIRENSLAVLPFLNLDGSDRTQIFANGLHEDVINRLTRIPQLRVSSRGDSSTLKPNSASEEVRQRLRVQMYLEGSVQMSGDRMRTTVQLIDTESGFHIVSRAFDLRSEDFFDLRDEITSLTVANVRVALPPETRTSALQVAEDPSLDAYVLYRRGIDTLRQPKTINTVAAAIGWFDAALEVDPEYAAAHAGKCAAFVAGYAEADDATYIDRATSACGKALTLNSNLDIVHTALGDLAFSTGKYADAAVSYEKALAIDPASVGALMGLGRSYQRQNRFADAEATLRKAIDIHPGDASAFNTLGSFYFQTGDFEKAAAQYEYAIALVPNDMNRVANLGSAYMMTGNFVAAAKAYENALEIEPTRTAYSNLGMMHYYVGEYDSAIESLEKAVELAPNDHLAYSNLGDALWVAGDKPGARGKYRRAETLLQSAIAVNPNDPFTMMDLAWVRAQLDRPLEARDLIDKAMKLAKDDPYSYYYDGLVHLKAGDQDAALRALSVAAEKGYPVHLMAAEPLLQALRVDPRFAEITSQG